MKIHDVSVWVKKEGRVMKVDKLDISDFRGIHNLSLELNGQSVVLFGDNGIRKSSVLDAIMYIYKNIFASTDWNICSNSSNIDLRENIKYGSKNFLIALRTSINNKEFLLMLEQTGGSSIGFSEELREMNEFSKSLPVLICYNSHLSLYQPTRQKF